MDKRTPKQIDFAAEGPPRSGVLSEATEEASHLDEIPAEPLGGPPRRRELSVTPSQMARRALEDATEAESPRDKRDPAHIDPDTLPA